MRSHNDFTYKKVIFYYDESKWYGWYLIHKATRQGVHFHGRQWSDGEYRRQENQFNFSCLGVEAHHLKPVYDGQKPIESCDVTGGDCYCDGTGMAGERFSHIDPDSLKDDEYIFGRLHKFYEDWINGD